MKSVRSSPISFRFDPVVKEALGVIADRDGRSMSNMIEWLIRQHCEQQGLGWPPKVDQDVVSKKIKGTKADLKLKPIKKNKQS